jgi:hypothetical protein
MPLPLSGPETVPDPISVAPLPIVSPKESVSVPPSSWIVPLVMLVPVPIVSAAAAPISSVPLPPKLTV